MWNKKINITYDVNIKTNHKMIKHITICSIGQQLSQKKESRDLDKDQKGLRPENKPTTFGTTTKTQQSWINNLKHCPETKSQEILTKELKGLRPEKGLLRLAKKAQDNDFENSTTKLKQPQVTHSFTIHFMLKTNPNCLCHYHKFIENDALIQYNKLYLKTLPRN